MISKRIAAAALAGGLLLALPGYAQEAPTADQVEQLTALARASLPMGRLEDGSPVPPETDAELARPIIPRTTEVQVIRRGMLSAEMEACGLNWQERSYLPFMGKLRAIGWSGKTMAYVGMLHGMSQGMRQRALGEQAGPCAGDKVAALEREAATLSIKTQ